MIYSVDMFLPPVRWRTLLLCSTRRNRFPTWDLRPYVNAIRDIFNCSGKLHYPGKRAFRRLGNLPQRLRTSPLLDSRKLWLNLIDHDTIQRGSPSRGVGFLRRAAVSSMGCSKSAKTHYAARHSIHGGFAGSDTMAASRGRGGFPVFATCPVVIWPIARPLRIKAKRRTGTASFIRRGSRLPQLHRHASFEDSLRALATKTRIRRHAVVWWRRPQAGKEHSSPTLPSPGGSTPNL
jgi:hypothetical protein